MNALAHELLQGRSAREVAESVEAALRSGRLRPGDRLPAVRALARQLGVSPATVASAYGALRRRGIAAGAGRGGTRIRVRPPLGPPAAPALPPGVRDLRSGAPDPDLLPRDLPFPAAGAPRLYGGPALSPRLARCAAEQLSADGIDATHLAAVGGALDGVERVLAAWLRVGDRVLVEDPCYSAVLDLLAAMGLEPEPVPVDERGMSPDHLEAALGRGASALILTPRAQNPTGAAFDPGRAEELARLLGARDELLLVEDDHAGPVAGAPLHTLAGATRRWAAVRSVSKWLGPDLRVAIVAGDEATVARLQGRQAAGTGWVSHILQETVAELFEDPSTWALLERASSTYARRRAGLAERLAERGRRARGSSGLTTWVPVGDEPGVVAGLLAKGWAVSEGARYRIASPPAIRIAHSTLEPFEAERLVLDLDEVERRPGVRAD